MVRYTREVAMHESLFFVSVTWPAVIFKLVTLTTSQTRTILFALLFTGRILSRRLHFRKSRHLRLCRPPCRFRRRDRPLATSLPLLSSIYIQCACRDFRFAQFVHEQLGVLLILNAHSSSKIQSLSVSSDSFGAPSTADIGSHTPYRM